MATPMDVNFIFFGKSIIVFEKSIFFDYRICASLTDECHYQQRGMTKYRVDRDSILPARTQDRSRNGTALLCTTRLIIDK